MQKDRKQLKLGDTLSIRVPLSASSNVTDWINNQTSPCSSIIELIEQCILKKGTRDISSSDMPTPIELKEPILRFICEEERDIQQIKEYCYTFIKCGYIKLSHAEAIKFQARVAGSIRYLKADKLIESRRKGVFNITELGRDLINKDKF